MMQTESNGDEKKRVFNSLAAHGLVVKSWNTIYLQGLIYKYNWKLDFDTLVLKKKRSTE